ncbi:MAG: ketol-acid reductoisomerase [Alphaproteobacteria bacterium]|nr:MAG: ketol-acid reductoisomerase [Alphaproteobacteria bacterium]
MGSSHASSGWFARLPTADVTSKEERGAVKIYREVDGDLGVIRKRRVAILGYGNQGHAHALNLRDSGVEVVIGAREGGTGARKAAEAGFPVLRFDEAAGSADVVMMTLPDEHIPAIYEREVAGSIRPGAALGFAHGLAVHFGLIVPREDLDVFLIGPKGAGRWLRAEYEAGRGLAALIAVHRDASGEAFAIALAYALALGCGRAGILETTFAEECETDLFGEQAVLCGGIPALIEAGFRTLVEAGYSPEMAYFECVHEAKLIVDLIAEGGFAYMRDRISTTAEYGGELAADRLVTDRTRAEMRAILDDIRSGTFARRLIADTGAGSPELERLRRRHPRDIDEVGERVRRIVGGK